MKLTRLRCSWSVELPHPVTSSCGLIQCVSTPSTHHNKRTEQKARTAIVRAGEVATGNIEGLTEWFVSAISRGVSHIRELPVPQASRYPDAERESDLLVPVRRSEGSLSRLRAKTSTASQGSCTDSAAAIPFATIHHAFSRQSSRLIEENILECMS